MDCIGYRTLVEAAERDEKRCPGGHDYMGKVRWVLERATHYAEKTGLAATDILDAWEGIRDYWYMNFYQDCNQPKLDGEQVRVFETMEDLLDSIGQGGYRCPRCEGVSKNAYECDSGLEMAPGEVCNWKSYGLFGTLGKGVSIFVKSELRGNSAFMPIAWETAEVTK